MLVLNGIGIFLSILLLVNNKGYKSTNVYLGLFLFLSNLITLSLYLHIFSNSKAVLAFVMSIPINPSVLLPIHVTSQVNLIIKINHHHNLVVVGNGK